MRLIDTGLFKILPNIICIASVLTTTLLPGCNAIIDHNAKAAKKEMDLALKESKNEFFALSEPAFQNQSDGFALQKMHDFQETILDTDHYLDSLTNEMDQLDQMDVNNAKRLNYIFLIKGVGDSIIIKIQKTIKSSQGIARTEKQKRVVQALSDSLGIEPDPARWKEQTFGLTSPLAASFILYGLRAELYKIGSAAVRKD